MNIRSTPPRPACASSRSSNSKPKASIGGSSKRIKASRIFQPLGPQSLRPRRGPPNKKGDHRPPILSNEKAPPRGHSSVRTNVPERSRPLLVLSLPASPVEGGDY